MEWLSYVSEARVAPASVEAAQIYLASRNRNRELSLTGYLHRENGYFLQYAEGPSDGLDILLQRLRRDWRHQNMRVCGRGPLVSRRFHDWDMAFSETPEASFATWIGGTHGDLSPLEALAIASADQILAFFDSLRSPDQTTTPPA